MSQIVVKSLLIQQFLARRWQGFQGSLTGRQNVRFVCVYTLAGLYR